MESEEKVTRVLQVGMHDKIGGVETFLMNYYRNIDRDKIQFDFINMYDKLCFQDEIVELGGKIYNVPNVKKKPIKYYKELVKIIKENKYNIVHVNMLSMANILPIIAAKRAKAKKIIIHSHNTSTPHGMIRKILDKINKKIGIACATNLCACSEHAGAWMFGQKKEFTIINNAIELEKYSFDEKKREKIRKKLKIKNNFVIGHIGRFSEQKNHEFIIKIFSEVCKVNDNARLLLIGEGELEEQIKNMVKKMHIEDKVIFAGTTNQVEEYLHAMDVFLLPSKFEGLGIVAIEAQAAGLKVVCSNEVPVEAKITENIVFLPLNTEIKEWLKEIQNSNLSYMERKKITFKNNDYDIHKEAEKLEIYYQN